MSCLPSALKRGFVLSAPGAEKRTGSPPLVDTTQISLRRLFSFSIGVVTCTATIEPSGLIAGAPTVFTLYQSLVSNARLPCAFEPVAIGDTTSTAATIAPHHTIQVFFTDSSFIPTV